MPIHKEVEIKQEDNVLTFAPQGDGKNANAMSGTIRALVNKVINKHSNICFISF